MCSKIIDAEYFTLICAELTRGKLFVGNIQDCKEMSRDCKSTKEKREWDATFCVKSDRNF